jgi:hypothetical protein
VPSYQPIGTIKDFEFIPVSGDNPFSYNNATPASNGMYELYITHDGKQGEAWKPQSQRRGRGNWALTNHSYPLTRPGYPNELRGTTTELGSIDDIAGFKTVLLIFRCPPSPPAQTAPPHTSPTSVCGVHAGSTRLTRSPRA